MSETVIIKNKFPDKKLNENFEEIQRKLNAKIKWILNPTFTTCKLSDSDSTHYLSLKWDEDEVVDNRDLNFKVNAGERTFDLTGNITVESSTTLDQDYTSDSTVRHLKLGLGMDATNTLDVTGDSGLNGAVTINDANADKDFRVEGSSSGATHLLFVNAGTNFVGINESAPATTAHITKAACAAYAGVDSDCVLLLENDDNVVLQMQGSTNAVAQIRFTDNEYVSAPGVLEYDFANERMELMAGTNAMLYIKNGYVTTVNGVELAVGDFGTPTNPFHVQDEGTTSGWANSSYGGVVARFRHSGAKHTSVCIDAQASYDPTLVFSEDGSARWDIRNDASVSDTLNIRYQGGSTSANLTCLTVDTSGDVEITAGKLSMDTVIPTAVDLGNSFTGSQITATGSASTDHALEIDGVYGAALIYTHTSSATADTMLWGDMTSTATTGDFNGLRPRLACNAASGGLSARAVYGEVIVGASKYASLAQGVLGHVSYAAGGCNITNIHALGAHISQGSSMTATNLYGIIATVQTRGDESISGNDYAMRLDNEAVGGTGRQMDGAIQIVNTNLSGGIIGYGYGLDLSGADIATADIILQNGETIKNTTDGIIDLTGKTRVTGTDSTPLYVISTDTSAWIEFEAATGTGYFGVYGGNTFVQAPTGNELQLYGGAAEVVRISNSNNMGLMQTTFGTNAAGVFAVGTETAPTTSPADCFQMYSADQSAGNACAHFRTENGGVIKIYQGSHIADAEASHTLTDASETCDRSEIEGFLDALGAKINAIYTAMENTGFLASS